MVNIYISVFFYLILFLLLICLCGVIIYGIKKYKKEKRFGSIFVTTIVGLILLMMSHYMLIVSLNYSSLLDVMNKDIDSSIMRLKLAANLAILPSQKKALYSNLGVNYMVKRDGAKAIENFDKALEIKERNVAGYLSHNLDWSIFAGMLYSYAGQYDKVYKLANETKLYPIAISAAIYQKDYKKALGYANLSIDNSIQADFYGQRAYIYRKLNNPNAAAADLNTAIYYCNSDKRCIYKQYKFQQDSYWADNLNKQKQHYGFVQ